MFFSKAETTKASSQSRHGKMQPAKLASGITVDELEEESPPSDGGSQKGACPSQFKLFEAAFSSSNEKSLWWWETYIYNYRRTQCTLDMVEKNARVWREVLIYTQPYSCSVFPETLAISSCSWLKWPGGRIPARPLLVPAAIWPCPVRARMVL